MARLFVSAAHKSSGKTTLTLGLCAALRARGLAVQPFKKGPDYIDPMWLSLAAGRACRNLDFFTMSAPEILARFSRHAGGADVSVIEGNKGLHDGLSDDGRDSSAALARLLRAPVLLVIDCGGITRGIAPLLLGYQAFEPGVPIGGVILNKVAGTRHEAKLRAAVEAHTDIRVLGSLPRSSAMEISERHLGLMPANEMAEAPASVARVAALVGAGVDLDRVLTLARGASPLPALRAADRQDAPKSAGRIGIARDAAFGFYYPEDLEGLEAEGFTLVPIDTLADTALPADLDGLFLGGGFPETHMAALEANRGLREDIRGKVMAGLPTYAECGGMMYLSRSISWQGRSCAMVGALAADAVMGERPQGRGYAVLEETEHSPWPRCGATSPLHAHEFHYARLTNLAPDTRFAYRVLRGHGIDGGQDGIVFANTLASFIHRRGVGPDPWPRRFAAFIRSCRGERDITITPAATNQENDHVQASDDRCAQHLLPRSADGADRRRQAV